jgi:hypothetical protein
VEHSALLATITRWLQEHHARDPKASPVTLTTPVKDLKLNAEEVVALASIIETYVHGGEVDEFTLNDDAVTIGDLVAAAEHIPRTA